MRGLGTSGCRGRRWGRVHWPAAVWTGDGFRRDLAAAVFAFRERHALGRYYRSLARRNGPFGL